MGLPAGASLAFFMASSNFFARMSSLLVSWNQESANLSSRWRFCSARIFWASVRSTFGPALTGVSCESTAPKTGSTVSFVWQHGHVTCRFSLFCFAIAVFYAFLSATCTTCDSDGKTISAKKQGHGGPCPAVIFAKNVLGLGGVFPACESRSGTQLRSHDFRVGAGRSLWRWRGRSARLFRQRLAFHQQFHFVGVDDFPFEERLRDALERFPVVLEQMLGDFAAEEDSLVLLAVGQRPQLAHTPFANHVARDVRGAFDVVARAGGDVAEEYFFRGTSAHQHGQHRFQVSARVSMLVVFRQLHREAESHAARNDRHFVDRIGARRHGRNQSVAGFVVRRVLLLFVR